MAGSVTVERPQSTITWDYDLLPETFVGPEMLIDPELRLSAGHFIGQAALGNVACIETLPIEYPIESLHEAIGRANEGDVMARQMIEANVRTDVIERTIKSGFVMKKVPLQVTHSGKLMQYGQTMDSIQANSLMHAADNPIMRARTEAETRNTFRTEQYLKDGFFDNYSLLVISRAEPELDDYFFVDTMSCSLQLTSKSGEGLTLESAFVAGVASRGKESHDEATTIAVGDALGADYRGKTPAEIIDTPILIRNDLIPNGVIDVVKLWDRASGTFFGENKPKKDYMTHLADCHKREANFQPQVNQITHELLGAAHMLKDPKDAIYMLNDLSGLHMVNHAIEDLTIDSRVFGHVAAGHIDAARMAAMRGDTVAVAEQRHKAQETEASGSCPSSMKKRKDKDQGNDEDETEEDDDADCDFTSEECPECHAKKVRTKVQKLKQTNTKRISGDCGCVVFAAAA